MNSRSGAVNGKGPIGGETEFIPVTVEEHRLKAAKKLGPITDSCASLTGNAVARFEDNIALPATIPTGSKILDATTENNVGGDETPMNAPGATTIVLANMPICQAVAKFWAPIAALGAILIVSKAAIKAALLNVKVTLPVNPIKVTLPVTRESTRSAMFVAQSGIPAGVSPAKPSIQSLTGGIAIITTP